MAQPLTFDQLCCRLPDHHVRHPPPPAVASSPLTPTRVLAIGFFALDAVEPFHQPFSLRNYTLRYPYAVNERVTIPLLFALVVVFPAVVIAVYTLVIDGLFAHDASRRGKYRMKERLWELNTGLLGLLLASGAAFVITGALKNATGKPRPDFVDRCKPNATLFDISSSSLTFELQNASICAFLPFPPCEMVYPNTPRP